VQRAHRAVAGVYFVDSQFEAHLKK